MDDLGISASWHRAGQLTRVQGRGVAFCLAGVAFPSWILQNGKTAAVQVVSLQEVTGYVAASSNQLPRRVDLSLLHLFAEHHMPGGETEQKQSCRAAGVGADTCWWLLLSAVIFRGLYASHSHV